MPCRRAKFAGALHLAMGTPDVMGKAHRVLSKNSADLHFESTNDSQINLRSGSMIEAQHSAESLGAFDGARRRFGSICRLDQPIIDPLVISLPMIMSGVLAGGLSQRPFAEEDHSIETLIFDRPDESLGVGVGVGFAVRRRVQVGPPFQVVVTQLHAATGTMTVGRRDSEMCPFGFDVLKHDGDRGGRNAATKGVVHLSYSGRL